MVLVSLSVSLSLSTTDDELNEAAAMEGLEENAIPSGCWRVGGPRRRDTRKTQKRRKWCLRDRKCFLHCGTIAINLKSMTSDDRSNPEEVLMRGSAGCELQVVGLGPAIFNFN